MRFLFLVNIKFNLPEVSTFHASISIIAIEVLRLSISARDDKERMIQRNVLPYPKFVIKKMQL